MTGTKAVRVSLLPDVVRREGFAEASRFQGESYECLTARRDALFELGDAVLCADGAVKSPVDLTLLPEHRRGHGAMYGGLNHGRIDTTRLRTVLRIVVWITGRTRGRCQRCGVRPGRSTVLRCL
ncbi:hypothetical protein GCM10010236_09460 [Streptomyces eurythermus]|nr:hypothetical protein GCM10010236_09460 [Streptomyces eurythermus]